MLGVGIPTKLQFRVSVSVTDTLTLANDIVVISGAPEERIKKETIKEQQHKLINQSMSSQYHIITSSQDEHY